MPAILKRPDSIVKGITLPCQDAAAPDERIRWDVRILNVTDQMQYEADAAAAYYKQPTEAEPLVTLATRAKAMGDVIRRVVVGWSNIVDEAGQPVPFDDAALTLFNLQQLYQIAMQLPTAAGWGAVRPNS